MKFQNFDTGSNWLEILLDNKEAIIFLGGMVACTTKFIQESYLKFRQTQHTIKELNTDEEARKTILKSLEQTVKMQVESHASDLMKEFNIAESHQEYHTKLTHSIKTLAELMSKGTEIHTALNAPQETKKSFQDPDTTKILIQEATKLLSDGQSENNNDLD